MNLLLIAVTIQAEQLASISLKSINYIFHLFSFIQKRFLDLLDYGPLIGISYNRDNLSRGYLAPRRIEETGETSGRVEES